MVGIVTTRADFTSALLSACHDSLGIRETSHNSGPEIDQWLAYVHARPGDAWCAAWVCGMHRQAAVSLDIPNPCPRTAGALRLWDLALPECRVELPAPGDVFVLDTGAPGGAGHVGIVIAVSPDGGTLTTCDGNSNEQGSREGNAVVTHTWRPREGRRGKLIGYLNLVLAVISEAIMPGALPQSPFK